MIECPDCGQITQNPTAQYCWSCGTALALIGEKELPRVGVFATKSRFRITYKSVEGVFNCEEAAQEAADSAAWGEDREFIDGYTLENLGSDVPPEKYPYVCGGCGEYVSDTNEGKCGFCETQNWLMREGASEESGGE